jgi:hypothetical protein
MHIQYERFQQVCIRRANLATFSNRAARAAFIVWTELIMADAIPLQSQLTGAEEEWLVRAAFGSPRGVMPSSVVGTLAAAGLGEKNSRGTLDVNDAGRQYIKLRDLPSKIDKR